MSLGINIEHLVAYVHNQCHHLFLSYFPKFTLFPFKINNNNNNNNNSKTDILAKASLKDFKYRGKSSDNFE